MIPSIRYVLGIDPGKTGAMAIFERTSVNVGNSVFPTYKLIDIYDYGDNFKIVHCLANTPTIVTDEVIRMYAFIENVHAAPGQSVSAMFNFGQNLGWWKGVLDALDIPYQSIAPQSWSPYMLGKTDNKKTRAREVATKKFSRFVDNTTDDDGKAWFRLAKHDGRADACLIAWYGIKKYILENA